MARDMKARKVLTFPEDITNPPFDNENHDLVVFKGDFLKKNEDNKYMVVDLVGKGTFSQVARCVDMNGEEVAIKIVKNIPKYYFYEMNEVRILNVLFVKNLNRSFVEIKDVFVFKQHLCIVEELLGSNLYELLKITGFKGIDHKILRKILGQVLTGLRELYFLGITHCDLKPENILIKNFDSFDIKIIDFGSAFTTNRQSNFYVQSRYYRAPEVILGIPYGHGCDIWSFGCIAFEMYMGYPLFAGKDNLEQIVKIYNFFGTLPIYMMEHGTRTHLYFEKENKYKPIINLDIVDMETVKDRIKSKNNNLVEDDVFIDFLMSSLTPCNLNRPHAVSLMNHPYLRSGKEVVFTKKTRFVEKPVVFPMRQRRKSEFGFKFDNTKPKNRDVRKSSVYNIFEDDKENS